MLRMFLQTNKKLLYTGEENFCPGLRKWDQKYVYGRNYINEGVITMIYKITLGLDDETLK
jgi:hypothetical protein